jgi:hypothetical protein
MTDGATEHATPLYGVLHVSGTRKPTLPAVLSGVLLDRAAQR